MTIKAGSKACRTKTTIDTNSTKVQIETEEEVEPFFINISSLPKSEINHLRSLGLLLSLDDDEFIASQFRGESASPPSTNIQLLRNKHAIYLQKPLQPKDKSPLPSSYISLDASKPWILYWTLHSLDLIHHAKELNDHMLVSIVHTLESCWQDDHYQSTNNGSLVGGGFGGGPNQIPHVATTYAAVLALCIIVGMDCTHSPEDTAEQTIKRESSTLALDLLRRKRWHLNKWFETLRYENSNHYSGCGYRMHHDGEVDVRASYCICTVSTLLNILTPSITNGMMEYIISCQTYEGGFGGEPWVEAHGGYTFCAIAALYILVFTTKMPSIDATSTSTSSSLSPIDILNNEGLDCSTLRSWLSKRQMAFEGGFQGRANKLVDGCYSFWVGGAIAIFDLLYDEVHENLKFDSGVYSHNYDPFGVWRYSSGQNDTETNQDDENNVNNVDDNDYDDEYDGDLLFDQKLLQRYILLCAQDVNGGLRDKPSKSRDFYHSCYNLSGMSVAQHVLSKGLCKTVLYENEARNIIGATHPVYNIRNERVQMMVQLFWNNDNANVSVDKL